MEVKFNVSKEERKALVAAVSEITGQPSVYKGAPGFAFEVGNYVIDRYGTLICGEQNDGVDLRNVLIRLMERGFSFEGGINDITPVHPSDSEPGPAFSGNDGDFSGGTSANNEIVAANDGGALDLSDSLCGCDDCDTIYNGTGDHIDSINPYNGMFVGDEGTPDRLSISMPLDGFASSSLDNLMKLVASKAWILKKMAGTDELLVLHDENGLRFPWFKPNASGVEVEAYSRLIYGLCETAKKKQRVMAKERQLEDGDNEKFKARCMLLSLGFIGDEYAQARKILLAPMSGNGSHKSGDHKKQATGCVTAADSLQYDEGAICAVSGEGDSVTDRVSEESEYNGGL